jgi:hypothetical protein
MVCYQLRVESEQARMRYLIHREFMDEELPLHERDYEALQAAERVKEEVTETLREWLPDGSSVGERDPRDDSSRCVQWRIRRPTIAGTNVEDFIDG